MNSPRPGEVNEVLGLVSASGTACSGRTAGTNCTPGSPTDAPGFSGDCPWGWTVPRALRPPDPRQPVRPPRRVGQRTVTHRLAVRSPCPRPRRLSRRRGLGVPFNGSWRPPAEQLNDRHGDALWKPKTWPRRPGVSALDRVPPPLPGNSGAVEVSRVGRPGGVERGPVGEAHQGSQGRKGEGLL